jgi:hypothetical protein
MARQPTGKPNGRPKKEIDQQLFENLCEIQCTEAEIAHVLNVGESKILEWCKETYGETFQESFKRFANSGKMSLRRWQMKMAQTNATMAIWLGKQYLGQSDRQEVTNVTPDTEIKIEIINDKNQLKRKDKE